MRAIYKLLLPAILLAPTVPLSAQTASAQDAAPEQNGDLDAAAIEEALRLNYVFPDRVPAIMESVREAMQSPQASRADKAELARILTETLIEATGDLHFLVGVQQPGDQSVIEFGSLSDPATNYGFQNVGLLAGNIGYLRLDNFSEPDAAHATASAALKMLENADGLIIDLRYNNGGYNELGQLIASHLFNGEDDTLLASYYYNDKGKRIERGQWVLSGVPGRRRPDMPVHILISSVTFSAAEWMAFSLQQTGRATVIGTQSSGGGHPIERFPIGEGFFIQVPIGEIRGPDGGEFEGVGVEPDIKVPSYRALEVSHLHMLEDLERAQPDPAREWALSAVRASMEPVSISKQWLARAAGIYDGRALVFEDGGLSYQWRERFVLRLHPLGKRLFAVEGTDDYRIELLGDGEEITGFARIFADGTRQSYEKGK